MAHPTNPPQPPHPGDRATAPAALEDASDTTWRQFEALVTAKDAAPPAAAHEQPSPTAGGDPDRTLPAPVDWPTLQLTLADESTLAMPIGERTEPGRFAATSGPARVPGGISVDDVMALGRRNNRACPMPVAWAALVKLLPVREQKGRRLPPPAPLDGHGSSPMQKRLRLRDQIEWAAQTGVLPAVYTFLAALPEEEWRHF
jgi:hypothetical protein